MRRAQSCTSGMNIATTGVLLRKAERAATGHIRRICAPAGMKRGVPKSARATQSRAPVSLTPAATT